MKVKYHKGKPLKASNPNLISTFMPLFTDQNKYSGIYKKNYQSIINTGPLALLTESRSRQTCIKIASIPKVLLLIVKILSWNLCCIFKQQTFRFFLSQHHRDRVCCRSLDSRRVVEIRMINRCWCQNFVAFCCISIDLKRIGVPIHNTPYSVFAKWEH